MVLLALLLAAPASAVSKPQRPLERYAEGTWASFVAMTDDAERAARRLRQLRRHAQPADVADQHRRVHVERGGGRAAADHRPRGGGRAARPHGDHARADGARRAPASTSTGTTSAPARSSRPGRRAATPSTPWLSSVDNGWLAVGLRIVATGCPSCGRARRRCSTRWTSASTTGPSATRSSSTTRRERRGALLLRHDRLREPDRRLHRDREGRDARAPVLRHLAVASRTSCDWAGSETSPSASPAPTSASVFEGASRTTARA